MKLTIILTVYNKEKFLRKAFEALLNQEGTKEGDYEVLAVNDGSTDGSTTILEDYAIKDSRVRILAQQNQGLSMARNNGADAALGEYVWFVDADDIISSEAVRLICDAINEKPDVIPIYAQTEGIIYTRNAVKCDAKTGKEIITGGHWEQCGVFWVLRKGFIQKNNLRFLPGVYHEDAEFTPRMLYAAKTVKVIPTILYTVVRDPESITQVPRPKRAFDCLIVSQLLSRYVVENNEVGSQIGKSIDGYTAQYINNAFDIIVKNSQEQQNLLNKAFYEKRHLLIRPLKDAPKLKYRIEAFLFSLLPKRYVWLYKQMKKIGACSIIR